MARQLRLHKFRRRSKRGRGGRGVWGSSLREISRRERIPPRPSRSKAPPPARSEQNPAKKFSFPFTCPPKPSLCRSHWRSAGRRRQGRKNSARANQKMRRKLFFGVAIRQLAESGGGAEHSFILKIFAKIDSSVVI